MGGFALRSIFVALFFGLGSCEIPARVTVENPTAFRVETKSGCLGWSPGGASSILVIQQSPRHTVWDAEGGFREMSDPIVYGVLPEGWENRIGPEPLSGGLTYEVRIMGGPAGAIFTTFTQP